MSKRSATETISSNGQPYPKASGSGAKRSDTAPNEMGEFEDAWEDEIESDEEVINRKGEDGMDVDDEDDEDTEVLPAMEDTEEQPDANATQTFIPGHHTLGPDEVLEPDDSVYIMRHSMNVNWPCLSFDVLRDDLGDERQRYPATAFIVSGTQADTAKNNEITVHKLSQLHRTQKDADDSDASDDEDDDDNLDEDPILEYRSIPHHGGINRIRAQPLPLSSPLPAPSQPYFVASWAETGKVHIHDVRPLIESLNVPGYTLDKERAHTPAFTVTSHGGTEGFAMDWAASGPTSNSLRLLTGDMHARIFLTTTTQTGWNQLAQPFTSHTSSIEDIQWSPSEPTIFASCSADQSVQIWDVRSKGRKSVAGIEGAHSSDVNVISWNRTSSNLLVSGGDEGGIKVWDLRNVKKRGDTTPNPTPVASFTWHNAPITSIEWHPTEDSSFVASSADDQVTLWDLAVEPDDEETGAGAPMNVSETGREVPPQLLFIHQGQKDVKEVHWHPQMPGTVVTTASDGFNIFKTIAV
ncbi:WD40-repeat-containing domain protein [Pterulicium gracile]|uniref:Glutamate-rich WD repeat-containing protein 1 n=1 Tax=Pterulicium gracile TaxID=1884261 RepID=A0A5C3QCD6_9AGAR|nr:WD40-repeat-containing domain protein [Pterula gracilis]